MTFPTTTTPGIEHPTEEGAVAAVIRSVMSGATPGTWEPVPSVDGYGTDIVSADPDAPGVRTVVAQLRRHDRAVDDDARLVAAAPQLLASAGELLEVAAVHTVALDMLPVDVKACAIAAATAPAAAAASVSVVAGAAAVMVITAGRRTAAILPEADGRWRVPSRADLPLFASFAEACHAAIS